MQDNLPVATLSRDLGTTPALPYYISRAVNKRIGGAIYCRFCCGVLLIGVIAAVLLINHNGGI
ncbi:MAG: hypothetical protein AAF621_05435 [Pseudomonadota bacterium]